jgi:hypothetical protein
VGMFTATAGTGSGIWLVNLFFPIDFRVVKQLVGKLVSSHFIVVGLFTASASTSSGVWFVNLFIFDLNFKLSSSLLVSL